MKKAPANVVSGIMQLMGKLSDVGLPEEQELAVHEWYMEWLGENMATIFEPLEAMSDEDFERGHTAVAFDHIVKGEFDD